MRYDDRLVTALRLPGGGGRMARIQWRQLVDLLGTAPAEARGELLDLAHVRLAGLSGAIPAADRAAMLAEPGMRLRSPRLVAGLAASEPAVARAALWAASLDVEQWLDLVPALPARARPLLAARRDLPPQVRALLARLGATGPALPGMETRPVAEAKAAQPPAPSSPPVEDQRELQTPSEIDGIGAIVRRIEAFRRARDEAGVGSASIATGTDSPRLPLGEELVARPVAPVASFDFASDCEGRIVWCEGSVAPMVVGTSLAATPALTALISHHQPIRAGLLTLAGAEAITGEWRIDASARFDSQGGRFTGHVGRLRRAAGASDAQAVSATESDRLRQMLHELRTPVNAIQGFAEIIQQQLFGPTPHEYRALAAGIAADAARMLAGFEELERFARLDTGAMELTAGKSDLAACLAATIAQLAPHAEPRGGGFTLHAEREADGDDGAFAVGLAPAETERLCWRLLASLAARGAPGEALPVRLERASEEVRVYLALPASMAALDDAALFHAEANVDASAPSAGMFGAGFSLRLVGIEARSAGGGLRREGDWLCLALPGLTGDSHDHSDEGGVEFGRASGSLG